MPHSTYHVMPLPDGTRMRGNWQVRKGGRNGRRIDTHTKKSAAENRARREARVGDEIVLHRVGGEINDRYTYSGQQSSDGQSGDEWANPFTGSLDDL